MVVSIVDASHLLYGSAWQPAIINTFHPFMSEHRKRGRLTEPLGVIETVRLEFVSETLSRSVDGIGGLVDRSRSTGSLD